MSFSNDVIFQQQHLAIKSRCFIAPFATPISASNGFKLFSTREEKTLVLLVSTLSTMSIAEDRQREKTRRRCEDTAINVNTWTSARHVRTRRSRDVSESGVERPSGTGKLRNHVARQPSQSSASSPPIFLVQVVRRVTREHTPTSEPIPNFPVLDEATSDDRSKGQEQAKQKLVL